MKTIIFTFFILIFSAFSFAHQSFSLTEEDTKFIISQRSDDLLDQISSLIQLRSRWDNEMAKRVYRRFEQLLVSKISSSEGINYLILKELQKKYEEKKEILLSQVTTTIVNESNFTNSKDCWDNLTCLINNSEECIPSKYKRNISIKTLWKIIEYENFKELYEKDWKCYLTEKSINFDIKFDKWWVMTFVKMFWKKEKINEIEEEKWIEKLEWEFAKERERDLAKYNVANDPATCVFTKNNSLTKELQTEYDYHNSLYNSETNFSPFYKRNYPDWAEKCYWWLYQEIYKRTEKEFNFRKHCNIPEKFKENYNCEMLKWIDSTMYSIGQISKVVKFDIESFEIINEWYAKDEYNVYYAEHGGISPIFEADIDSFQVLEFDKEKHKTDYHYSSLARDKNVLFVEVSKRVVDDVDSFERLNENFYKDNIWCYWKNISKLKGCDSSTFQPLNGFYAKDASNCYYNDKYFPRNLHWCDPETFQVTWENSARDNKYCYDGYKDSICENDM